MATVETVFFKTGDTTEYKIYWSVSPNRSSCDIARIWPPSLPCVTWASAVTRWPEDLHNFEIARRESARKALGIGRSEKHQRKLVGTRQERRAVYDAIRAWLYDERFERQAKEFVQKLDAEMKNVKPMKTRSDAPYTLSVDFSACPYAPGCQGEAEPNEIRRLQVEAVTLRAENERLRNALKSLSDVCDRLMKPRAVFLPSMENRQVEEALFVARELLRPADDPS